MTEQVPEKWGITNTTSQMKRVKRYKADHTRDFQEL